MTNVTVTNKVAQPEPQKIKVGQYYINPVTNILFVITQNVINGRHLVSLTGVSGAYVGEQWSVGITVANSLDITNAEFEKICGNINQLILVENLEFVVT